MKKFKEKKLKNSRKFLKKHGKLEKFLNLICIDLFFGVLP